MFIIDASVVVKWFIEEKDSSKALLLKEKHASGRTILIAPDLLIYEVTNVFIFSKIFASTEIKKFIDDLYALEIDLIYPSIDILQAAVELSIHKHISVYDACYLALAKVLDIKLITADEKLCKLAPDSIELLSHI